jgi:hypothetical protein
MPMPRIVPIVLLAVMTITAAACGGGGGSGGQQLSKEEFASKANQICTDIQNKVNALSAPKQVGEISAYVDKARSVLNDGLDRMRALQAPSETQAARDKFVSVGEHQSDLFNKLKDAAKSKDIQRLQQIQAQFQTLSSQSVQAARGMGASKCAGATSG